ncbi:hypothetical protein SAMD00019534_001010 [Acytostelium subglobosum LB1]|uniref:hypothetical protein n=1 Tax=Acytostelium subglobosum LB1 TaxID=1410327 RepID=UPI0006451272|nr:hypothetical protein SAMD00019534_001010 [Acytostelium subglobosum LB1]GAM16926.1 hypothetical protein SAMD00019534_001010 [Acytostelium subglobosum LB1]|eukprot:XP_012758988.1 hypothetical protein SAMD00019534_001010 [Acytostelium subglobosum LB1]
MSYVPLTRPQSLRDQPIDQSPKPLSSMKDTDDSISGKDYIEELPTQINTAPTTYSLPPPSLRVPFLHLSASPYPKMTSMKPNSYPAPSQLPIHHSIPSLPSPKAIPSPVAKPTLPPQPTHPSPSKEIPMYQPDPSLSAKPSTYYNSKNLNGIEESFAGPMTTDTLNIANVPVLTSSTTMTTTTTTSTTKTTDQNLQPKFITKTTTSTEIVSPTSSMTTQVSVQYKDDVLYIKTIAVEPEEDMRATIDNNTNTGRGTGSGAGAGLLFAFSIGSLFGWSKKEDDDAMLLPSKRKSKEPVTDFEGAMEWYQTYYQLPDLDNFVAAMSLLLGKESQMYLKAQLASVKNDKDMQTIAKMQTIQSFYYIPMVGFMAELFKQNPAKMQEWYDALMSREDITTPWKSTLGNLDPAMLLALAVSLVEGPQSDLIQQSIVKRSLGKDSDNETKINEGLTALKTWSKKQKESLPTYPLLMIGEYLCTGDEQIVKKIVSMWRRSLDSLEKMGMSTTVVSNTSNDINRKLEFQQREMIIDELSQAIRLLFKDAKAKRILNEELDHHLKSRDDKK